MVDNSAEINTIEKYRKLDFDEFIRNYEVALSRYHGKTWMENLDFDSEQFEGNVSSEQYNNWEINFITKLTEYNDKWVTIILSYMEHAERTNKYGNEYDYSPAKITVKYLYKALFLGRRLSMLEETKNVQILKTTRISTKNLLEGEALNLKERYTLLLELLNWNKTIIPMNILIKEKQQLLAYILGCNFDIAKDLMNNQYDAKIKTSFTTYLSALKDIN